MRDDLPDYDSLPLDERGWRSGWSLFGEDDQLGLVNLLTPSRVARAAGLVRRGVSFAMDVPVGSFDPPLNPRRQAPAQTVIRQPTIGFDDAWDHVYPQSSSQWDSLAHVGIDRATYYNGATSDEIEAGQKNGIGHWARHGITGRAVVLDVEAVMLKRDSGYSPASRTTFGVAELEEARGLAGIEYEPGDVLLLHTGFSKWYLTQSARAKAGLPGHVVSAGLEPSEDICRYLWNSHVAAVCADNFSVEVWPADFSLELEPFGFIHQVLIGSFGMALGELWWLDDLIKDCRRESTYVGMIVGVPWNAPSGIGSPANAVVLK